MKNEKGITLIALIITIIVMLILVAVTIAITVNGGLIEKSKTAKEQTNKAIEKETLQSIALGYLDDNAILDQDTFISECSGKDIINKYTLTKDGEYVKATKDTSEFYINKNGGILDQKPQSTLTVLEDVNNHLNTATRIGSSSIADNWLSITGELYTYYILVGDGVVAFNPAAVYDGEVYVGQLNQDGTVVESIAEFEGSVWDTEGNITKQQILTDLNNVLN